MKSAPPKEKRLLRCLFPVAGVITDGIVEVHPSATCFRCHTFERHPATKNKQLMGKEQKRNGLQTKRSIDTSSVSRSFFLFVESLLLPQYRAYGKLHSFKKNQVILYR